jgi:hypothetical protein
MRTILISLCFQPAWGQTRIDLETQSKNGGAVLQNASQLGDLVASRTSSTTLVIGEGCSIVKPCNARFGSVTFSFTSPAAATISGGSGVALIYLDANGDLTVGHNLSVACGPACQSVPGVAAFPPDSIPLFAWTATNGTWDVTGGIDLRAFQSTSNLAAGTGLLATTADGRTTLSIDPTLAGIWAPVPASSSTACAPGNWSVDTSFYYVCVAANSWRRAPLSTW